MPRIKPRSFLLWGSSAKHRTNVWDVFISYMFKSTCVRKIADASAKLSYWILLCFWLNVFLFTKDTLCVISKYVVIKAQSPCHLLVCVKVVVVGVLVCMYCTKSSLNPHYRARKQEGWKKVAHYAHFYGLFRKRYMIFSYENVKYFLVYCLTLVQIKVSANYSTFNEKVLNCCSWAHISRQWLFVEPFPCCASFSRLLAVIIHILLLIWFGAVLP